MIRVTDVCAAAAALMLFSGGTAAAEPLTAGGLNASELAAALQRAGYRAKVEKGDDGEEYVAGGAAGVNFDLYPYDCKDGRCASAQFVASFDVEKGFQLAKANQWNREKRFASVYLDDENDPHLQRDINLSPGGTTEALEDEFRLWDDLLSSFMEFIDW